MDFNLTGEQELLRDGLTKFLAARYDLAESRSAAKTGPGWQPETWRAFADELGILGATFPEDIGGIGGGPIELMVIAEALGHALVIEPYVGTVVVAGGLLVRAGTEAAHALLEQIAAGTAVVALADGPGITARADGDGWVLSGSAAVVTDAPLATHLLIAADTGRGTGLFLTEFDAAAPPAGLTVHGYRTIDDRRAADLELDGVTVSSRVFDDAAAELARARDEAARLVPALVIGAGFFAPFGKEKCQGIREGVLLAASELAHFLRVPIHPASCQHPFAEGQGCPTCGEGVCVKGASDAA